MAHLSHIGLILLLCLIGCLDRPDEPSEPDDYVASNDDDATEDPWEDPFWDDDDDDDSAMPSDQLGTVSFSYNFVENSADYWDCQRRYRWIQLDSAAAGGCADCLSTWRVEYQLTEDSCGAYGWNGDGYQLDAGLDPVGGWLWFSHDQGTTWLRFPGQGSLNEGDFDASWTWPTDCFDIDGDGSCDPGSEMSYRELFKLSF